MFMVGETHGSSTSAEIKITGLSGLLTDIVLTNEFEMPSDPRNEGGPGGLPGLYTVTFTLCRPGFSPVPDGSFSYAGAMEGDSHLAIAPPAFNLPKAPAGADVAIRLDARTPEGHMTFRGLPNQKGFLGKLVTDPFPAAGFKDAEARASRALASGLSNIATYLDVPLHIYQIDVTEQRTENLQMSLVTPFRPTPLVGAPLTEMAPELRFYTSLYREALSSNSPPYQFLCYFKVLEGLRKRHERLVAETRKQGAPIPKAPREYVPATPTEQREWLQTLFPLPQVWDELALLAVFPKAAQGRKLNDVIDKELTDLRHSIAHAVLDSGEPTLHLDEGHDRFRINDWLPLTKCLARALLRTAFPDVFRR